MDNNEDSNHIDIKKYKKFNQKLPWSLVIKILIVVMAVGLLYYFQNQHNNVKKGEPYEILIEE